MYKDFILSHIEQYLSLIDIKFKKSGKVLMIKCPFCEEEKLSATVIPNTNIINCLHCKIKYNILDIAKKIEKLENKDEEEILYFLKEKLNLDIQLNQDKVDLEKIIDKYISLGFDFVPIAKNQKKPIELEWTTKSHRNKEEILDWISKDLNIGVKTGIVSNITVIDIDQEEIPKEIENLLGNPLIQKTKRGYHLFYSFDKDLPKTCLKDFQIDIENTGGQVLIYPSKFDNYERKFLNLESILNLSQIPLEFKEFLIQRIKIPNKTYSEQIIEDIKTENFKINPDDFKLINNNLENCCNSSFIKLGGMLRKQLNLQQTSYVVNLLNKHLLEKPMEQKSINAMIKEIDKYISYDNNGLEKEVLRHLQDVEKATQNEIELMIFNKFADGENKNKIGKILLKLLRDNKIIRINRTEYKLKRQMNWRRGLLDIGKPLSFKMPYFDEFAKFNVGDMVIIGAPTGFGKTHLAMNIVKRLTEQNIEVYYVYNETGGRFASDALKLGLDGSEFYHDFCSNPEEFVFPEKSIIIYDWLCPTDFARTDKLFERFANELHKTESTLICFVQLKKPDLKEQYEFFARNQIDLFASLCCKYLYEQGDGIYTKFEIDKIRERKTYKRVDSIPCKYYYETGEVKLVSEIQNEENKESK